MKLTENQIDELYKFTREHYVYFYDVQSELVDHLANDIEEIWVDKPKLSFEDARDTSFKKFGIFGFMDVIDAKQKAMNKRYWKIILRFAKEWFTVPKIVITISVFFIFFMLLQIQYSEYIFLATLLILITLEMRIVYFVRKQHKKKEAKKEKIFLLESMIGDTKNGFTGFTFVNLFNTFNLTGSDFSSLNMYWVLIISVVLTLLCILFYVSNYIIPQKAEELLHETYPEYKLVNNL
ncbi:hypothetical protein BST83_16450 [Polaribacter filamentus]|uniref:Uncharacterized protein n=1 Tax=Polaribacter filamentus TaxID=53483 RepID=A0A2S7L0T8_9FLAO|nr:hypothetical protein [Polaribacter filamentus]PQB08535.1 hypothetical protein BST83_16450 [Polaribacter filamentus]